MAPLLDRLFSNPGNIPQGAISGLCVRDFSGDTARALGDMGWDGVSAAGAVGIELSPDNSRVLATRFAMVGMLSKEPAVLQATKLWATADKAATVTITFPLAHEFDFNSATMASDYLSGDRVKIVVAKNGQPILPTDWPAHGIGKLSLRIIVTLEKTSNGRGGPFYKHTVLGFPHTVEEMEDLSDHHQGVGWPGVKILEGRADLRPRAPDGSWGAPIYPLLAVGRPLDSLQVIPAGAELRYHMAKLLNTARKAVAATSHTSLKDKWKRIIEDESCYEELLPSITWPAPVLPTTNQGIVH